MKKDDVELLIILLGAISFIAPIPEYEIGSVIYFRNRKLKVVESEDHSCNGCYFQYLHTCAEPETLVKTGLCSEDDRKDHKEILFERLKV